MNILEKICIYNIPLVYKFENRLKFIDLGVENDTADERDG